MRLLKKFRNVIFDLIIGKKILAGTIKTTMSHMGCYNISNSDYDVLSYIFRKKCAINESDVLVDVGCGKGRVINYWLLMSLKNKIYGIEIDNEIAKWTSKRLRNYSNVEIICGDINQNIPQNASLFYLFNPFNELILEKFRNLLEKTFQNPDIKIVYYNTQHLDVFKSNNKWEITEFDIPNIYAHRSAIIVKIK